MTNLLNLIYILIIIIIIIQLRKRRENFTDLNNDKILKCINENYILNQKSIDNLNTIAKEINTKNNLKIASDLDLTDSKIIINHNSSILSGLKEVNLSKNMIRHGDVISLKGNNEVFASFQNCKGKDCKKDNHWSKQFKVEALKFIPEINKEMEDNIHYKNYQEKLKTDSDCNSRECVNHLEDWIRYRGKWYYLNEYYYNRPEGKYIQLPTERDVIRIGTHKFDKYVGLETSATLNSQHNSKEGHLYRKNFLQDCEIKEKKYKKGLCANVKEFKPIPKRKLGEYII